MKEDDKEEDTEINHDKIYLKPTDTKEGKERKARRDRIEKAGTPEKDGH